MKVGKKMANGGFIGLQRTADTHPWKHGDRLGPIGQNVSNHVRRKICPERLANMSEQEQIDALQQRFGNADDEVSSEK